MRGILFNGEMVRAILEGRKTQTRRVLRGTEKPCPYGKPGDELWVRETWQAWVRCSYEYDEWEPIDRECRGGRTWEQYLEDCGNPNAIEYRATSKSLGPWTPAIHMPRWASRITLEIESVRVERVQAISKADAIAEGFEREPALPIDPRDWFRVLWDSINASRGFGWDENPYVFAITFRRVKP